MSPPKASFVDPKTLDKIDKLFTAGIGDHISLPQLVVVGDQSSGKSSVLEGLTALPFPRDSGLCTRFATQITFRRAKTKEISVSIIPDKETSQEDAERLRRWEKRGLTELDSKSFAAIMREVNTVMRLSDANGQGGSKTFAQDVLKLDICGPDQEHFSIVDVPGIFRVATEGVTTEQDKDMVRSMVEGYMENPRSVVITVIPANVDVATQEILTLAKCYDPDGNRTIGVLTKPDLVDRGAEMAVMELVKGTKYKLKLGWCIVRNLAQNQLDKPGVDRSGLENAFFDKHEPWKQLEKDRVGVASLKSRLAEIIATVIRREFPKVKVEIAKQITTAKASLTGMGPSRVTAMEQSNHLLDISARFQRMADCALRADYAGSKWFRKPLKRRLATYVVNRNETLENTLRTQGHTFHFGIPAAPPAQGGNEREEGEVKEDGDEDEEDDDDDDDECEYEDPNGGATPNARRFIAGEPDLSELEIPIDECMDDSDYDNISDWLDNVYRSSRGFELGTFDSSLLSMTMKAQSEKWEGIALDYITDIITTSHQFIKDLLRHVCSDEQIREGIMSVLLEELLKKYQLAINHVEFLLHTERSATPATVNHYFNDNLQKGRQERLREAIDKRGYLDIRSGKRVVSISDVLMTDNKSNAEHTVMEIHDILQAYYKVALKRFADNLCMQATDYYLMTGPNTPLRLFSPQFVTTLTEDQLAAICEEDGGLKKRRTALIAKIASLEKAKKIIV